MLFIAQLPIWAKQCDVPVGVCVTVKSALTVSVTLDSVHAWRLYTPTWPSKDAVENTPVESSTPWHAPPQLLIQQPLDSLATTWCGSLPHHHRRTDRPYVTLPPVAVCVVPALLRPDDLPLSCPSLTWDAWAPLDVKVPVG